MEPETTDAADNLLELEESPYLRRQKQVEVRRSRFNRCNAARAKKLGLAALGLSLLCFLSYSIIAFGLRDPRFKVSEDRLEVVGLNYISRRQVVEKFAGDVGRSIFLAPLERRRAMLEEISWVEAAAVSRAWPDRLRVRVRERAPVAFLRTPAGLALIDGYGVILERPDRASFTFPVITGLSENDPVEVRRERVGLYTALVSELDSEGGHHSLNVSEVDLGDPEDARVVVAGREGGDAVVLHLGNTHFLARYKTYLAHIGEWRQQFDKIQSIDLRYDRQIVVNPNHR